MRVSHDDFSDAVLVLVGHGSTQNAAAGAPVRQHAAELRRRKIFAEVREAFWKQEPRVMEVLAGLGAPRVFIVPLFISEGYFSGTIIPRELGLRGEGQTEFSRIQRRGSQTWIYCKPIGTHSRIAAVLLASAREVVARFPFPRAPKPMETTLFLAGHGTDENENSRLAVERQVEQIRGLNLYAAVHGVFLEEEPRIGECLQIAQTRNVVIVPFFISDGMHAREDIPVRLGEPRRLVAQRLASGQPPWRNPTEKRGKLVWYAPAIGTEPAIAEVILDRVREAAV
jgi:sirohydrochlorin cobaltochelatase